MDESDFHPSDQNPSSDEYDPPSPLDIDAEPDFVEADLVEAEFVEADNADFEVPYQYSDDYLSLTTERVDACIEFFDSLGWRYTNSDLRELREHFYAIPDLTSHHLLELLQRGGHSLGLPLHKLKPAKTGKFDKAYHARKVKDMSSFLANLPALMTDFLGKGKFLDGNWKWERAWDQHRDKRMDKCCGHLMDRLRRRQMEQIPAVLGRLDANPHADILPSTIFPPHPAVEQLINAAKILTLLRLVSG